MNIVEWVKKNKFLAVALFFALLNIGAIFLIFGFQHYSDSSEYISVIHWFQGKDVEVASWRVLRPLGPFLALPFEFLGEGAGLIVQNVIFYLLCTVLIFKITELIFHNQKQALLASLFFVFSTQVIEVGLAYLTDTGAWFFYFLSIFLTLLYFKNKKENLIALNGLLSGIGFLMKENGGLGILFFLMMILLSREWGAKEKALKIIRFGVFFLIPLVVLQVLMYHQFRFTSLHWYLRHTAAYQEGAFLTFLRYLGQLFRTLGVLWIFFFVGLREEWREKYWERLKIYLALVPSSLSFFLWPTSGGGRVVFIFSVLGILLATCGLKKRGTAFLTVLLLVVLVLNYWFCLVNQEIPFTDILYTSIFSK